MRITVSFTLTKNDPITDQHIEFLLRPLHLEIVFSLVESNCRMMTWLDVD